MIKVIHDYDYVCCAETLEDFLSPATVELGTLQTISLFLVLILQYYL